MDKALCRVLRIYDVDDVGDTIYQIRVALREGGKVRLVVYDVHRLVEKLHSTCSALPYSRAGSMQTHDARQPSLRMGAIKYVVWRPSMRAE